MIELFEENSAIDLSCRGFNQDEILALINVDVGYHGRAVRDQAPRIDRFAYKATHIRQRRDGKVIRQALTAFGEGGSMSELAHTLGLGSRVGDKQGGFPMRRVFAQPPLKEYQALFKAADTARRKRNMRQGAIAKYGVDNVFKLDAIQQQAAATRTERYGAPYTLAHGSTLEAGARSRILESTDVATERRRVTMIELYGEATPMLVPAIKQRFVHTMMTRHGVEHPSQIPEIRRRQSERMSDQAYLDELSAKRMATCIERYGSAYPTQSPIVRAKLSAAAQQHTADERAAALQRAQDTSLERYGYRHASQRPEFRADISQWMREHRSQIAQSTRQTWLERSGVDHYVPSDEARRRQSERMRDPAHQQRITQARKRHHTMAESKPENLLRGLLEAYFGKDTILTQHHDLTRYPFACDFYIPARDLFIELNGTWTHGRHWFDAGSEQDQSALRLWSEKGDAGQGYYQQACYVWSDLDVRKRRAAADAKLNYVVFWDGSPMLADARLWLAMGAPDGADWRREYSWIPERRITQPHDWPTCLSQGPRKATVIARTASWKSVYARELAIWHDNGTMPRRWGRVQGWLYANRLQYLGKTPDKLSDVEIMRGMTISALVKGYSVFDNTAMRQLMDARQPHSIYDPCAGWGERLVTCAARGVTYHGVDINPNVIDAHQRIISQYHLTNSDTTMDDAAHHIPDGSPDMVFTCPPYGDTELYSDHGAEHLDDTAFTHWWSDVVACASVPSVNVFALQTNQRWRSRLQQATEEHGWTLDTVIDMPGRASHLNRPAKGVISKHEHESVLVFTRTHQCSDV